MNLSRSDLVGVIAVTLGTSKMIRQKNLNAGKHGMNIANAAAGFIKNVMEDAFSKKKTMALRVCRRQQMKQ